MCVCARARARMYYIYIHTHTHTHTHIGFGGLGGVGSFVSPPVSSDARPASSAEWVRSRRDDVPRVCHVSMKNVFFVVERVLYRMGSLPL